MQAASCSRQWNFLSQTKKIVKMQLNNIKKIFDSIDFWVKLYFLFK